MNFFMYLNFMRDDNRPIFLALMVSSTRTRERQPRDSSGTYTKHGKVNTSAVSGGAQEVGNRQGRATHQRLDNGRRSSDLDET